MPNLNRCFNFCPGRYVKRFHIIDTYRSLSVVFLRFCFLFINRMAAIKRRMYTSWSQQLPNWFYFIAQSSQPTFLLSLLPDTVLLLVLFNENPFFDNIPDYLRCLKDADFLKSFERLDKKLKRNWKMNRSIKSFIAHPRDPQVFKRSKILPLYRFLQLLSRL